MFQKKNQIVHDEVLSPNVKNKLLNLSQFAKA
jgi:hypothetical protein